MPNFKIPDKVKEKPLQSGAIAVAALIVAFMFFKFGVPAIESFFVHNQKEEAQGPVDVPAVTVISRTLERVDQLPGEIHAYQDVAIFPKVPGFIKWIGVDRGSIVKKGDLMVVMYAPEYLARRNEALSAFSQAKAQLQEGISQLQSARAEWRQAKAQLLSDDSTYQRVKAASLVPGVVANNDVIVLGQTVDVDRENVKTWESKVLAAESQVDALKENVKVAQHGFENYKDFADYLNIYAPFDGYITKRDMHVGSFVGPLGNGAYPEIVRIQQLDLLRIVTPVPEINTAGVLPGAKVEFTVSTFPGRRLVGTVARLGNYLEQKTRTMPVELNYFNPDYKVLPGMFCEVYWPTRRPEPTLFVPITSVVSTTLDTFICRIKGNDIEWVPVKKGEIMGEFVEIFGDVYAGEVVAQYGSDELRPGQNVKPVLVAQKDVKRTERPTYHLHAQ
ncbi:MAG: efflux RND transporter periplasmic adaptor subunit [Candidatus Obscuribacterales bacterium]|nr:efflux RND transporter periplasmic adaptor subunit [Candidatus Obscuribacterales bacterium]